MPMGAKNGNAVFQRMMEDLLGPVRDCADPFVDDIIIGSGTEDMSEDGLIKAHEKDLGRVLDVLDCLQLVCKPTKASLFVKEVQFAEHVVGHGQRRPMPGKLAALNHWKRPTTISELCSFMGFCNYYSGYVRMYAELSGRLHKMLQVGKFDGRKRARKSWLGQRRRGKRLRRSRQLSCESWDFSLSIGTKDLCSAPMHRIMPWEQSCSRSKRMVPMLQWPFGLELWWRGNWTARKKETYAIICALRKWAYWFATHCCVHRPSKFAESPQGAPRHPLGSGSPTRAVVRDASQV